MNTALAVREEKIDMLAEVDLMQSVSKKLMQTPHYAKLGGDGIFAIIQKARSLNVSELDALNGGLYYTNGRVGMSAEMMCMLIRMNGHSITKDAKSNDTVCILHGKRSDNGDTWTESFSIEDAKRAGIFKNTWEKYPRNMCYCRALSNLARQLFPDVIKGCYEIEELKSFSETPMAPINYNKAAAIEAKVEEIVPELSEGEKLKFYENFNGDIEMTKKYVEYCTSVTNNKGKKKDLWTDSKTITELQKDIAASSAAYLRWKAKQKTTEEVIPVTTPSMEPVSIFENSEENSN